MANTGTGDVVWVSWHSNDTYTCTMDTGTASDTVWTGWFVNSSTTTTTASVTCASVTCDNVWRVWLQAKDTEVTAYEYTYSEPYLQKVAVPARTVEQIEADRIAAEQRRAEEEVRRQWYMAKKLEEQKARAVAAEKANLLLMALLTAKQREEYAKTQILTVISKDGRRTYQIVNRGSNVYLVDDKGKRLKHYCIYPDLEVPQDDTVAAKLLMLRHAEGDFLKIANAMPVAA